MNPVVSGSMRPGFAVGGVVISERIPVNQLVLRDVIVFKDPENPADLIVHRIVHMTVNKSGQTFIKTRGDANNTEDPWTFTIQGKYAYVVRWSVPLLGYAAVAYQNHRGLVLLGAGILLIGIAASTTFGIRRRGEEQPSAGEPDPPDSTPSTTSVSTNGAERPTVNGAERPTVAVTPKVSSTVSRKISSFYDDEERLHSKDPPTLEEYTETRDWNDR
jgi:signal peptidase